MLPVISASTYGPARQAKAIKRAEIGPDEPEHPIGQHHRDEQRRQIQRVRPAAGNIQNREADEAEQRQRAGVQQPVARGGNAARPPATVPPSGRSQPRASPPSRGAAYHRRRPGARACRFAIPSRAPELCHGGPALLANIPATQTVIEISRPGGPEVLVPATRPVPEPKAGEVLIRIAARRGQPRRLPAAHGPLSDAARRARHPRPGMLRHGGEAAATASPRGRTAIRSAR